MVDVVFLGTGGGRVVSYTQMRWTGGIRFLTDRLQIHLDPGPGSIVRSIDSGLSPQRVKALFISHAHPDHCCDAEVFIEAMTRGMTRSRGTLVASRSVLSGNDVCEASVSRYHQGIVGRVIEAKPGSSYSMEDLSFTVAKALHSDPDTVGYCLDFPSGRIGYTSDTEYFEEMDAHYSNVRLLVLCVMRPRGFPWKGHMTVDDAVETVGAVRPEMVVITHLGAKMVLGRPSEQAKFIEAQTGVRTIAATDGMRIRMEREIEVKETLRGFDKRKRN